MESTQGEAGTQQSPVNGRFKKSIQLLQPSVQGAWSPPGTAPGTWDGQKEKVNPPPHPGSPGLKEEGQLPPLGCHARRSTHTTGLALSPQGAAGCHHG